MPHPQTADSEPAPASLQLLQQQRRAQLAEMAAHGFTYEWNMLTGQVERSAGVHRVLGYQPEELAEDIVTWGSLIHPDDYRHVGVPQLAKLETQTEYALEYRLRHRDGHYIHVWDQGIVQRNTAGTPVSVVGITIDISARKQIEQELHETQARLRAALEKARLTVTHADRELRYTWVYNPHVDYPPETMLGRRDDEVADDPRIGLYVAAKEEVLRTGRTLRCEFTFAFSEGDRVYDVTIEPLRDAAGEITGVMTAGLDITEHKTTQAALEELNATLEQKVAERTAALEQSNRELQRSNRELDRFAYVASHDLKAPLRGIDNLAMWIAQDAGGVLPPASQGHLLKLRGRVRRLEYLLDDLLHYSRAGRRRRSSEDVDTASLLREIIRRLQTPEGMQVRITGDLPRLHCEREPFETALRNLLENAVKHHHRPQGGTVTVAAEQRGEWVEFCVADDGPGIDPQYHARIFEVFQTLRPRDEVEGSGMGLAIVKKTVESVGGQVWVESAGGEGARFCFTWPLTS